MAGSSYDVAIVGGGPAGLSAALLLGRCRRRVVLFDHGQPRNMAARAVNGYLGLDGVAPHELRERGRAEAAAYGVEFVEAEVTAVACRPPDAGGRISFELRTAELTVIARRLLLASGLRDELPVVENIRQFYGRSVHHCPYCDGWEHRDQRLAALAEGTAVVALALKLARWSPHVIACSDGHALADVDHRRLAAQSIVACTERLIRLDGSEDQLSALQFETGRRIPCDALFFKSHRVQRSRLPEMLGCSQDPHGLVVTTDKQGTGVPGLFLAGDADGDAQFAIVAAAEGAKAATAINHELQEEDHRGVQKLAVEAPAAVDCGAAEKGQSPEPAD